MSRGLPLTVNCVDFDPKEVGGSALNVRVLNLSALKSFVNSQSFPLNLTLTGVKSTP